MLDRFTRVNRGDLVRDPGLAQLRRYLPVLAVVAAPFAGLNGAHDPLNPLDPISEWNTLAAAVAAAADRRTSGGAPLALVRALPPTSGRLREALQVTGRDAFRVVHLVCYGERDMLYLEDENGHEAYVVAEHLVRLFEPGEVELVVLEGCFSRRIAQLLVDQTSVRSVLGTRRQVTGQAAGLFATALYAGLAHGDSVRTAYRAALGAIAELPDTPADRYEIIMASDCQDTHLTLPDVDLQSRRPLLGDGQPAGSSVPQHEGFAGRRELLSSLAHDIPASRVAEITGPVGIGKSWLAAQFASRFGWRFPDGVVWIAGHSQMTVCDVTGRVARVLNLPTNMPPGEVAAELGRRRVLVVLDQLDAVVSRAELERLGAWLESISGDLSSAFVLTTRQPSPMLSASGGGRSYELQRLPIKEARMLAMRQAVEHGVDSLDVDTIDEFLERTQHVPWLIVKGVELVEAEGIEGALDRLGGLRQEAPDPVPEYLGHAIRYLRVNDPPAMRLLSRLQNLPDGFDIGLAQALGNASAPQHVAELARQGLLQSVGEGWYVVPLLVRGQLRQAVGIDADQQGQWDQAVLAYLVRDWPERHPAALNTLRAILQRWSGTDAVPHPALLARALVLAAPAYRDAGLAEEFVAAATPIRDVMPAGDDLGRLQLALGEALRLLPGRRDEAGWLFQITREMAGLDHETLAAASRAYARHLVDVDQAAEAVRMLSQTLRVMLTQLPINAELAAGLAHEWAITSVAAGRLNDASARFRAALAGYAEVQRAEQSAAAQCDYGALLITRGELDQAEEVLGLAQATADRLALRDLAARARELLAAAHLERAERARQAGADDRARTEQRRAVEQLGDALLDRLPIADPLALGRIYHGLGRAQAMAGQVDDAAANAARSCAWHDRAGDLSGEGVALLTVGQLRLAQGDTVAAQAALHQALDAAEDQHDADLLRQAAGVLVRLHQIRARRAGQADRLFRVNALDQVAFSLARLATLGLDEHTAALEAVIQHLSRP